MDAATASCCLNPEHGEIPDGGACLACYESLSAENTRMSDRYMKLLQENGELWRKIRDAEGDGRLPLNADCHVHAMTGPAGAEMVNGTGYLQVRPRSRSTREDVMVLSVGHRTTGNPRSILLERSMARQLHSWLGWWLRMGWPGVPRQCGAWHKTSPLSVWKCDRTPGHRQEHEGPPVGWPSSGNKPGRAQWDLTLEEIVLPDEPGGGPDPLLDIANEAVALAEHVAAVCNYTDIWDRALSLRRQLAAAVLHRG